MTILDRYIVRQLLSVFLFGLLTFLLIFVVINMMERLDDFIAESSFWFAMRPTTKRAPRSMATGVISLMISGVNAR